MSDRAMLTVGRDYCRGCERPSKQTFAGWATPDGHENRDRPRAFYRQCDTCRTMRLVLSDVTDAEGLCRNVAKRWFDGQANGARVTATETFSDGRLDPADALIHLQAVIWSLYTGWQPKRSANSFLAYASDLLPRRLAQWSRETSGEPEGRAKGRRFPKAHAASVSTSLDALASAHDEDGQRRGGSSDTYSVFTSGGDHAGLGGFVPDHAEAGTSDLMRVLAGGGREGVGDLGGQGGAAPGRAAA